jgi:hypothetical protein
VRFLWAKNMDAAKDIHKEMLPIQNALVRVLSVSVIHKHKDGAVIFHTRGVCRHELREKIDEA